MNNVFVRDLFLAENNTHLVCLGVLRAVYMHESIIESIYSDNVHDNKETWLTDVCGEISCGYIDFNT